MNVENNVDFEENQELPGAIQIMEGEDGEQILEISEVESLESPSPSPTPLIVVSDGYRETFDTSVEDMQPITLFLAILVLLITLFYIIKGVDYGEFN